MHNYNYQRRLTAVQLGPKPKSNQQQQQQPKSDSDNHKNVIKIQKNWQFVRVVMLALPTNAAICVLCAMFALYKHFATQIFIEAATTTTANNK